MGSQQRNPPQLGATFYPGGSDDFYMPEVISPSPQRVTPEIPEKIQHNLAHLELDAGPVNRLSGLQSPAPTGDGTGIVTPSFPSRNSSISNLTVSEYTGYSSPTVTRRQGAQDGDGNDHPIFSHFPPLRNRPANVPPSDDEKEGILEKARTPVLTSNDPEMQLTWAQDALAFVEIAAQHETRLSENQSRRPQTPQTEHQLRMDALNIVSFLSDQHHPKAEFLKGMWLEFGKFGFRMDKKEAFRCYQRAAQRGYARAEYRMGMQFESSNEPEKAIKHYRLGVEAGDSASHYRLGMMTLLGQHGQPLDYERGVKLISYAAETADENAPQGAYVLGMLQARELTQIHLGEQYLPLNISKARFNIEKAAYLGFAKAQAKIGSAYELCQLGCDFSPALSLHYNALAAKQGEADAEMAISKWFLCGYVGVFDKNEELAFNYARRAAQSGLATAEFAMGYFYEVGIYVQADLKTSRTWYEKAADHGNKDAAARIDGISRSKTLSRKDHENVAVAKIRSQYGSHRGERPERFKNPPTTMPTISDNTIDMPDMPEPYSPRPRPGDYRASPYPKGNGSGPRPPPSAPYPLDDRGRSQQRPAAGNTYPNQNPSKSTNIPPSSPVESEVSFPDSNYRGSAFPTFKSSTQHQASPVVQAAGRGSGVPPHNAPTAQSGQGYRQPSTGYSSAHGPGSPATTTSRPQTAHPPAIDIGFSAPPDPSGADRQRRLQKSEHSNMRPLGALPRKTSYDSLAGKTPDRLSSLPHPQTMPNLNPRKASPQGRPVSAGRGGPLQTAPSHRPEHAAAPPSKYPKVSNPDGPAATPPPTVPIARPPGKGPKTFQEMGVPASKQESDCVVM